MNEFEIDAALERFARAPLPERLAAMDDQVLSRIVLEDGARISSWHAGTVAAGCALWLGVLSAGLSPAIAKPISPLDSVTTLAPSNLLSGLLR